jgi:hypothetical protein
MVVFERDPTYYYLALFVYQLMEAGKGGIMGPKSNIELT